MDKLFHSTIYQASNYLSMLGLKLNHVGDIGVWLGLFSVTRGNNFGLVSSWFFVVLLNKLSNEQLSCLLFVIPWRSSDQVTFIYSALNSPVYIEPVMVWCHSEGKKQLNQCWSRYGTPDKCHQRLMSYSNLQSHSVVCLYTSIWEGGQGKAPSLNSLSLGDLDAI